MERLFLPYLGGLPYSPLITSYLLLLGDVSKYVLKEQCRVAAEIAPCVACTRACETKCWIWFFGVLAIHHVNPMLQVIV